MRCCLSLALVLVLVLLGAHRSLLLFQLQPDTRPCFRKLPHRVCRAHSLRLCRHRRRQLPRRARSRLRVLLLPALLRRVQLCAQRRKHPRSLGRFLWQRALAPLPQQKPHDRFQLALHLLLVIIKRRSHRMRGVLSLDQSFLCPPTLRLDSCVVLRSGAADEPREGDRLLHGACAVRADHLLAHKRPHGLVIKRVDRNILQHGHAVVVVEIRFVIQHAERAELRQARDDVREDVAVLDVVLGQLERPQLREQRKGLQARRGELVARRVEIDERLELPHADERRQPVAREVEPAERRQREARDVKLAEHVGREVERRKLRR